MLGFECSSNSDLVTPVGITSINGVGFAAEDFTFAPHLGISAAPTPMLGRMGLSNKEIEEIKKKAKRLWAKNPEHKGAVGFLYPIQVMLPDHFGGYVHFESEFVFSDEITIAHVGQHLFLELMKIEYQKDLITIEAVGIPTEQCCCALES